MRLYFSIADIGKSCLKHIKFTKKLPRLLQASVGLAHQVFLMIFGFSWGIPTAEAKLNSIFIADKEGNQYELLTSLDTNYIIGLLNKKVCSVSLLTMEEVKFDGASYELAKFCHTMQDTYSVILKSLRADIIDNDFTNCMSKSLASICDTRDGYFDRYKFVYLYFFIIFLISLSAYYYPKMNRNMFTTPVSFSMRVDKQKREIEKLSEKNKNNVPILSLLEKLKSDIKALEDKYFCIITLGIVNEPITLSTGLIYDKSQIKDWISRGNRKCPQSNQTFTETANTLPEIDRSIQADIKIALDKLDERLSEIKTTLKNAQTNMNMCR